MPPPFNLAQGLTLLSKSIIPKSTLKEFLFRCSKQFIVYIWTSISLAKMIAYLRKITKETGIEIDLQRIMGWDLCRINKHFLQFPIIVSYYRVDHLTHDKFIYHKNRSNFFPRYPNTHLGNTLLVNNTPYRTCLNPPFFVIFVESYEYAPKMDNYLMKILLLYFEFFHNSRLNVPTFVEFYLFGTIKENDGRFWMFEKCTMAYFCQFL